MDIESLQSEGMEIEHVCGEKSLEGITTLDFCLDGHACFIKSKKYLKTLETIIDTASMKLKSMVAIVDSKLWEKLEDNEQEKLKVSFAGVWKSPKADLCMCQLSEKFYRQKEKENNDFVDGRQMGTATVHPSSMIAQSVFIGAGVQIGPNVTVYPGVKIMSHSSIGEGTVLYPNVTIYPRVKIGNNCRVHANSTIGADGFGYHFSEGVHHKIWHFGGVLIGDHVEVGSSSCVDGGTFSPTIVGDGTKIDNHVQVAHNCKIGKGVILCGHVAIGGSTKIGDYVVFGGKSATGHDLEIASQSEIAGGALVNCDWPSKVTLGGHPARPLKEWLRGVAFVRRESLKK